MSKTRRMSLGSMLWAWVMSAMLSVGAIALLLGYAGEQGFFLLGRLMPFCLAVPFLFGGFLSDKAISHSLAVAYIAVLFALSGWYVGELFFPEKEVVAYVLLFAFGGASFSVGSVLEGYRLSAVFEAMWGGVGGAFGGLVMIRIWTEKLIPSEQPVMKWMYIGIAIAVAWTYCGVFIGRHIGGWYVKKIEDKLRELKECEAKA